MGELIHENTPLPCLWSPCPLPLNKWLHRPSPAPSRSTYFQKSFLKGHLGSQRSHLKPSRVPSPRYTQLRCPRLSCCAGWERRAPAPQGLCTPSSSFLPAQCHLRALHPCTSSSCPPLSPSHTECPLSTPSMLPEAPDTARPRKASKMFAE